MRDILVPRDDGESFLRAAKTGGYGMKKKLLAPSVGDLISHELRREGLLIDYTELIPSYRLHENSMTYAALLHDQLNRVLCKVEKKTKDHIPLFSVRVFEPGEHGTTVHRNHPVVGPWAIGVTLRGKAPFNVYEQDQLPYGETIDLVGSGEDPVPLRSMNARAGSAWALYTPHELVPHSSGIVNSSKQRELLIFYATENY